MNTNTNSKHATAWETLDTLGATIGQKMQIKQAFAEWGRTFNPNIKENEQGWRVGDLSYIFSSEKEAEIYFFVENTLMPTEQDIQIKIRRMALICHISGIQTEYKF